MHVMEFNYKNGHWLQYRNSLHKRYPCPWTPVVVIIWVTFIHTPVLTLILHSKDTICLILTSELKIKLPLKKINCDHLWENRPSPRINWYPLFACTWKIHPCSIQKHQALDDRLPGLLLQTASYRCCETMRVHFMVLRGINGTVWGCSSRQSWPPLWTVSVCATSWRHSTALWVWVVALPRLQLPTRPRLLPSPLPPAHPL